MEKVLITGANGYIGSNLLPFLEGKYELHLVSRNKMGTEHNSHELDIADFGALERLVGEIKPDACVHLAATGFNYDRKETFEELVKVNFTATQKLADACANCRFIYLTTYMECRGGEKPIAAGEKITPQSPYALSKSFGTEYLLSMARSGKLDARVLRIFSVYGLNDRPFRFIPSIFDALIKEKVVETTSLRQARDFVYVKDVAAAIVAALGAGEGARGRIFNVGSGKATALLDVASKIKALYPDSKGEIKIGAKPDRPGEAPLYFADISDTASVLGWKPEYPLEQGLNDTKEYYARL